MESQELMRSIEVKKYKSATPMKFNIYSNVCYNKKI
jgi:hypothetical protein